MAFGGKATTGNTNYTTENGGNGKDVFFPTASGKNGAAVENTLRMFPNEEEVKVLEWGGEVTVRGQRTFRTCIVSADNPWDNECRAEINKIKAELAERGLDDKEVQEQLRHEMTTRKLRWTATRSMFLINVFNMDAKKVQIFKGSFERHKLDDVSGKLVPTNANGGKTLYAKLLSLVQTGARVKDGKKIVTLNEPHQFDIILVCKGQGQMGKSYDFRIGFADIESVDLGDAVNGLPRYDITGWAEGNGVWPNEALQELKDGGDYYKVAEKYNVALYPEPLAEISAGDVLEEEVEEEGTLEELFK